MHQDTISDIVVMDVRTFRSPSEKGLAESSIWYNSSSANAAVTPEHMLHPGGEGAGKSQRFLLKKGTFVPHKSITPERSTQICTSYLPGTSLRGLGGWIKIQKEHRILVVPYTNSILFHLSLLSAPLPCPFCPPTATIGLKFLGPAVSATLSAVGWKWSMMVYCIHHQNSF